MCSENEKQLFKHQLLLFLALKRNGGFTDKEIKDITSIELAKLKNLIHQRAFKERRSKNKNLNIQKDFDNQLAETEDATQSSLISDTEIQPIIRKSPRTPSVKNSSFLVNQIEGSSEEILPDVIIPKDAVNKSSQNSIKKELELEIIDKDAELNDNDNDVMSMDEVSIDQIMPMFVNSEDNSEEWSAIDFEPINNETELEYVTLQIESSQKYLNNLVIFLCSLRYNFMPNVTHFNFWDDLIRVFQRDIIEIRSRSDGCKLTEIFTIDFLFDYNIQGKRGKLDLMKLVPFNQIYVCKYRH